MIQTPINRYQDNAVQTASPAQLLIMLYDGAIRFCKGSIEAIEQKKYEKANQNLCKAQAIVNELVATLDRSYPISEQLVQLYDYVLHLLIQANVKKQTEPIQEVLGYLVELKETWVQAIKSVNSTTVKMSHG